MYNLKIDTILKDPVSVLMIGLMTLRGKLVRMRDIDVTIIDKKDKFINYKIDDIDYNEASIYSNMLLKRDDIMIATYTKKHLLDNFFEFKVEFHDINDKSIMDIKMDEMEKAIEILDKIYKETTSML